MNPARKGRVKKDYMKWWKDRISILRGRREGVPLVEEVYDEVKCVHNDLDIDSILKVRPWTGIKLAILSYYIGVYSVAIKSILEPKKNYHIEKKNCYIDTFSGSGLALTSLPSKDPSRKVVIYGSPSLGMIVPRAEGEVYRMIDRFIFIEKNDDKARILETVSSVIARKLGISNDRVTIIQDDMNDIDYRSIMQSHGCSHALVFVDPYCCEPRWETMEKLLRERTDVLINFMISGIRRQWGNFKSRQKMNEVILDHYFGTEEWRNANSEEDLLELYINKIRSMNRIVIPLKVINNQLFYYYLLLVTRRTRHGSPWLNPIKKTLMPRIEITSKDRFKALLSIFEGYTKTIDNPEYY